MSAFYIVVQYVPDPVADERINIGVIVFGDGRIYSRFVRKWGRVQRFGGESDIAYIHEFVEYIQSSRMPRFLNNVVDEQRVGEKEISRMAEEWNGSIRLTKPKASLYRPDVLLERMASLMLRDAHPVMRRARNKQFVANIAATILRSAILDSTGSKEFAENLVQRHIDVHGHLDRHKCDIGVQNGHLLHGAWTVSFDISDPSKIDSDIKRAAWAIDDIRKANTKLPLSVLALRDSGERERGESYSGAAKIFDSLGARLVDEADVLNWAKDVAVSAAAYYRA